MRRAEFQRIVQQALEGLPKGIKERLENIAVAVEDLPPQEVVEEMGLEGRYDLLGLYQGISLDRRGFYYGNVLPDKISLYQRSIERQCRTRQEMIQCIQEVVLHEIGHYFGLDDEELYALMGEDDA